MSTKYTTRSIKVTKSRSLRYHIYNQTIVFFDLVGLLVCLFVCLFVFSDNFVTKSYNGINLSWRRITMSSSLCSSESRNAHKLIWQKTGKPSALANLFSLQKNVERTSKIFNVWIVFQPFWLATVLLCFALAHSLARSLE